MNIPVSPPPSLTEQLAAYWCAASLADIPVQAKAKAKMHILDLIACGVAGGGTAVVNAVVKAQETALGASVGAATLWGRAGCLPVAGAALANGTAAHALELDDVGGCGHSGAVVIPAVFALAEQRHGSGAEVLAAVIAGYDVAARVLDGAGGYRSHNKSGWHSTGTCGSFGAAAGAARMLGLDQYRFAAALGIAGSYTGGIWAFLADGAMTKRFHAGKAAETGIQAALLAAAGMTGPRLVLEAEWGGFYSTTSSAAANPQAAVVKLGENYLIERSGIKMYACCRTLHACIDGILDIMRETGEPSSTIARVEVHGNAQTVLQFSRKIVTSMLEAQFSAPYCVAVAAESGGANLDQFTRLRTDEAEIRRLMSITEIVADRDLGSIGYPSAEIHFIDGRRMSRVIDFAKGTPENPVSKQEIEEKAHSLLGGVLGVSRAEAVIELINDLDNVDNIGVLGHLLNS